MTSVHLKQFQKFRVILTKINIEDINGRKWVSFVDVQHV